MSEAPGEPGGFVARHFDGLSAEPRAAFARATHEGVLVRTSGADEQCWPYSELQLVRGMNGGEPVQLERRGTPVTVLVVEDPAFMPSLRAALPRGVQLARAGNTPITARLVLSLLAVAVTLLFGTYRYLVPAVADFATDQVSPAWERRFGDAIVTDFSPAANRETDARIVEPVRTLFARLVAEAPGEPHDAGLVLARHDMVNAFAAPGGVVVVTTGLLRALRSPEELAAVLAHELGHVRRRHSLHAMLRQLSLQALVALVAGDQSAISGGLRAAGQLGGLSYSRGYEVEADDDAVQLLIRSGLPPTALADALESIMLAAPPGTPIGFLSTHPAPQERLARIRAAALAAGASPLPAPAMSGAAWGALKAALPVAEPR